MKYQRMGRSGLEVPPLCLGTMTFGLQVDQATSFNILDEAFEQKLTFLDTADVYPLGGDLSTIGETCLLYTSPSPRDLSTSRMPSSA